MVANIRSRPSPSGALYYNKEKVDKDEAEVLLWQKMLEPEGFKRKRPSYDRLIDRCPNPMPGVSTTSLIDRLKARKCELCGATDNLVMHHVRKLGELKGKENWEKLMIARRRKAMAVCGSCHQKIHHGTF